MASCPFCEAANPSSATRCTNCGAELAGEAESHDETGGDPLLDLIKAGKKIEAIQLYRERMGVGLNEAKAAVEALMRGDASSSVAMTGANRLEQEVIRLLQDQQKIPAIKLYRQQTKVGLRDAKEAVEALGRKHGIAESGGGCFGVLLSIALLIGVCVYTLC